MPAPALFFIERRDKMQKSTGQFTQSGGQALSPLVRLVRLGSITRSPLPTRQARKFLSPLNEMQMSTGKFTLSTRIMSTVLENPRKH